FPTVLSRLSPETGVMIFSHTANDTLDYTGPKLNRGSKVVFIGVGRERRKLPEQFRGALPPGINNAIAFTPGCLVIDGQGAPPDMAQAPAFADWPLVFMGDDAQKCCESDLEFLWTIFTRFEPASDIYPKTCKINRLQASFEFPFIIDCRMKPHYPKEVACDPETSALVDKKFIGRLRGQELPW